jgi:ribosomal protein S27AE
MKNKKKCPKCGSINVLGVHYGFIDDPDAIQQIKNGKFATGGCLIEEDSPKWECGECKNQFGEAGFNF